MSRDPKPFFGKKSDPTKSLFEDPKPFFGNSDKKENSQKKKKKDTFFKKMKREREEKSNLREVADENVMKAIKQARLTKNTEDKNFKPKRSTINSPAEIKTLTSTEAEVLKIYQDIFEIPKHKIYKK